MKENKKEELINDNIKKEEEMNKNKQENLIENNNLNTSNNKNTQELLKSPIKKSIRKNSIIPRRFSLKEKQIYLNEMPSSKRNNDEEIKNILNITAKKFYERTDKENHDLFTFFVSTHINDQLRSDILQANISVKELCDLISQFISVQIFKKNDNIYIIEEKSELIYIILRGNIGLYKLDVSYQEMTYEQYLLYLYDIKKLNNEEKNIEENNINQKKEFVDNYLLLNIIEDNKSIYSIRKFSDLEKIRDILFLIMLSKDCNENNGENVVELYNVYDYPFSKFNYQDVIDGKSNFSQFRYNLKSFFKKKEYFYLNQMTRTKNLIKKLKYVQTHYLEEYDYFGNFELIETKPIRNETARCESSKTLLLAINKKNYSTLINDNEKNIREKELEKFHNSFFFRDINKNFFKEKIYSQFKIIDLFVGDELFKENDRLNNFYMIKEGIIEISMNNYSIIDLKNIILKLYLKIRKYVHLDINLREKMIHSFNVVKDALNLKRKFLIFSSEKGFYGEYELYFSMPSLFTATVISKQVKLFLYSYEKFNKLYNDVIVLQEGLKYAAIQKIQKIIERLVSIYNSYFSKIENEFSIKALEQSNEFSENKKTSKNSFKKISSSIDNVKNFSKHIKNNSNYQSYNNKIFSDIRHFTIIPEEKHKKEISNEYYSQTIENNSRNFNLKKFGLNTLYTSIILNKPKKEFLPPIVRNEGSLSSSLNKTIKNINETGFSSNRNKTIELFNFKIIDPYYLTINHAENKYPLRIEKNAPLINRIKNEEKGKTDILHNKIKKKIKENFNVVIRDINHLKNFNKYIDKSKGGYYLAVQQFVDDSKAQKIPSYKKKK